MIPCGLQLTKIYDRKFLSMTNQQNLCTILVVLHPYCRPIQNGMTFIFQVSRTCAFGSFLGTQRIFLPTALKCHLAELLSFRFYSHLK
mmetsp:Transcript_53195/g.154878  ORF Transcript_53195/g.154878 Transcript_53195/m.154878 type:complete len:88 (-) Transcript_53195:69-332(-)